MIFLLPLFSGLEESSLLRSRAGFQFPGTIGFWQRGSRDGLVDPRPPERDLPPGNLPHGGWSLGICSMGECRFLGRLKSALSRGCVAPLPPAIYLCLFLTLCCCWAAFLARTLLSMCLLICFFRYSSNSFTNLS